MIFENHYSDFNYKKIRIMKIFTEFTDSNERKNSNRYPDKDPSKYSFPFTSWCIYLNQCLAKTRSI